MRIFAGEHAMLSVATIAPNTMGTMHHHPEEQWGVLIDGSVMRIQGGEEIPVRKGDSWRTPGGVPHTMRAGPEGGQGARHRQPAAARVSRSRQRLRPRLRRAAAQGCPAPGSGARASIEALG